MDDKGVAEAWCLPVMVVVSLSGFFEIVEAVVAWNVKPELGIAYLGTQGDIWDARRRTWRSRFSARRSR